jgi:hypothetical protein
MRGRKKVKEFDTPYDHLVDRAWPPASWHPAMTVHQLRAVTSLAASSPRTESPRHRRPGYVPAPA